MVVKRTRPPARSRPSTSSKPKNIRKASSAPKFIKFMLYGEPGCGKTPVIGSSPKALILNADGPDAVESARAEGTTADIWDMTSWDDMYEAMDYFRRGPGCEEYEWLWLDSASLWQELGLDDIMDELVAKKAHRNEFIPDQHEYLENYNRFSKWVRHMRPLPIHFGITAMVMSEEDEEGNVRSMPLITGKNQSPRITGYFTIVGRLYVKTAKEGGKTVEKRVLQARRSGPYVARDRFQVLPTRMEDPTIPKIMALVSAGRKSDGSTQVRRVRKRPGQGAAGTT